MELVKKEDFNGYSLDIFGEKQVYFITRKQIGEALEYSDPQKAIDKIHERHKEKLDELSVTVKLTGTDLKLYDTILYNLNGVLIICLHSRQPRAEALMNKVYNVMFIALSDSQKRLKQAKARIADLSEANTRLNLQYQQQHQERKQLKDQAANLESVAKLQETPAGMIAADFLKALNKAVSSGTYAITKVHGKCAVDGVVIGVYDRDYLYIPPDTAADIYNEFGMITEIASGILARNLEQARVIQKRIPGKYPKRNIDGMKRECIAVYLSEIRKVMKL